MQKNDRIIELKRFRTQMYSGAVGTKGKLMAMTKSSLG